MVALFCIVLMVCILDHSMSHYSRSLRSEKIENLLETHCRQQKQILSGGIDGRNIL